MFSEETKINRDSLIAKIWKWQIVIFWILAIYVVFSPAGNPKDTLWYISVSLSISLIVVCALLILFSLFVVVIKRHNLGAVKVALAVLILVLCNVPGSMASKKQSVNWQSLTNGCSTATALRAYARQFVSSAFSESLCEFYLNAPLTNCG